MHQAAKTQFERAARENSNGAPSLKASDRRRLAGGGSRPLKSAIYAKR
jgi:hypothetical protein